MLMDVALSSDISLRSATGDI